MQLVVEKLIGNFNKNYVVKPLIKKERFILLIKCVDAFFYMELKDDLLSQIIESNQKPDIVIEGDIDTLKQILQGEILLRNALSSNHVEISSTMRNILLLESLFYMVNVHA
jgi:hypothetical protein